jgi:hypothetical protein
MSQPEPRGTHPSAAGTTAGAPMPNLRPIAHYPMWMWRCAVVLPHPALAPALGPGAPPPPPPMPSP